MILAHAKNAWVRRIKTLAYMMLYLASIAVFANDDPEIFIQVGHTSSIYSMALSPNGRVLAAGDGAGKVILWNSTSAQEIVSFPNENMPIVALAYSPSGERLYALTLKGMIVSYDPKNATRLRDNQSTGKSASEQHALAVSPDGKLIAEAGLDGVIRLFDADTLQFVHALSSLETPIHTLRFSRDGRHIYSGGEKGIIIFDIRRGNVEKTISFDKPVRFFSVSSDERLLAATHGLILPFIMPHSKPISVSLVDIRKGRIIGTLDDPAGIAGAVDFSPDGKKLAVAVNGWTNISTGQQTHTAIWDLANRKRIAEIPGPPNVPSKGLSTLHRVLWAPDSQTLFGAAFDGTLLQMKNNRNNRLFVRSSIELTRLMTNENEVTVIGKSSEIMRWDMTTGRQLSQLGVEPMAFDNGLLKKASDNTANEDIQKLVAHTAKMPWIVLDVHAKEKLLSKSFSYYSKFRITHTDTEETQRSEDIEIKPDMTPPETMDKLKRLPGITQPLLPVPTISLAKWLENDGARALIAINYRAIGNNFQSYSRLMIWNIMEHRIDSFIPGEIEGEITALAASPNGKWILLGREWAKEARPDSPKQYVVELRRKSDGEIVWSSDVYNEAIEHIAISPDSHWAIIANQFAVSLFNMETHQATPMSEHDKAIESVAFSQDGKFAFAGANDHRISIWDMLAQKPFSPNFDARGGTVVDFATSNDGRLLYTVSEDHALRVWRMSDRALLTTSASFYGGDWATVTPEGYFAGSPRGIQQLSFRVGGRNYPLNAFYDVFYRPDLVQRKLAGENINIEGRISILDALVKPPPEVELEAESRPNGRLGIRVGALNTGGGIGQLRIYLNGKLVFGESNDSIPTPQMLAANLKTLTPEVVTRSVEMPPTLLHNDKNAPIAKTHSNVPRLEKRFEIDAAPGENEITALAFNGDNTVQSLPYGITRTVNALQRQPRIHILAIGIDKFKSRPEDNLAWAGKDAGDFAEYWEKHKEKLPFGQLQSVRVLHDETARRQDIMVEVERLVREAHPQDAVLLFIASHGLFTPDGYVILTHDYSGVINRESLLTSHDLMEISRRIPAQHQILVLDTCHAGGLSFSLQGLYDSRVTVLAKNTGLHLFASAGGQEEAIDGYLKNGLFTHVLLKGLGAENVDTNKDRLVSAFELGDYAMREVPIISRKLLHRQTPVIVKVGEDIPLLSP